jgi:hypothetical protein
MTKIFWFFFSKKNFFLKAFASPCVGFGWVA